MNIVASEVGIDVSSQELVTSIDQAKAIRISNTQEGAEQLAALLPSGSIVHVESSGGYERIAVRVLRKAGFQVRIHNPLRARRLAQGVGPKAKTDPIDAKLLSERGRLLPVSEPKSAERQDMSDLSRAIDTIKGKIAGLRKRRNMPGLDEAAKQAYAEAIKALQAVAKKHEIQFAKRIAKSSYKVAYELAKSVDCVGPVTTRCCLSELPENFRTQPPARISSYAGLAPIDDSSGKRNGPARIGQGNCRLKKAMYMPAVTAIAKRAWARDLYARLRAKGRTHDQAIVAVMRKILVQIVSVIQRGSPWQAEPPRR